MNSEHYGYNQRLKAEKCELLPPPLEHSSGEGVLYNTAKMRSKVPVSFRYDRAEGGRG